MAYSIYSGQSVMEQEQNVIHHKCEMNFLEHYLPGKIFPFHNQTAQPTHTWFHFEYIDDENSI